jgi:predicted negative regulator of RcsB-dependent stress response
MTATRLIPLCLLAIVAALLVGCGQSGSNRNAEGAYQDALSAMAAFENKGAGFALALQDCTNLATSDAAGAACAKQELQRVAAQWQPVATALSVLERVASDECKATLAKAVGDASLLNGQDSSPPATLQEAEALTTQISDAIQQVSQEIEQAKESCS